MERAVHTESATVGDIGALRGPDCPWQFLNFLPLPHGQASLRPTLGLTRQIVTLG
jgi:hypothetical protein